MDPRPYNYEFRRPRLDNRTYQSYNAYESLYHMGKVNPALYNNNFMQDAYVSRLNRYSSVASRPNQPGSQQQPHLEKPMESYHRQYQNTAVNTDNVDRSSSHRSVKSRSSSVSVHSSNQDNLPVRPSVLSTYGSNSIERNKGNVQLPQPRNSQKVNIVYSHTNDTSQIFQKQQKPFDIINLYSRHAEPLRKYPKLTRQHLILERGMDLNN